MRRGARVLRLVVSAAAIGLLSGLVGLLVETVDDHPERWSVDVRFQHRGDRHPDRPVVLVAFDNRTLRELKLRPPIPRAQQARLIDNLDRAGANVIAYDYSLEQPSGDTPRDKTQDMHLYMALANTFHAVVSVTAPARDGSVADLAGVAPFDTTDAVKPGYSYFPLDPQAVVRRFYHAPGRLRLFSVAAADLQRGHSESVPRRALIDYPGPAGSFPPISFIDVLNGHFDPAAVRGKVVVVGPTAPVLADLHRVPVDSIMSGPEIQAAEISTALRDFPLRPVSDRTAHATLFLVGLTFPLLLLITTLGTRVWRSRRSRGVPLRTPPTLTVAMTGVIAAAIWVVIAQLSFNADRVVEVIAPLATIAASTLLLAISASGATRAERRAIRRRFINRDPNIFERVLAVTSRRGALGADDVIAGYRIIGEIGRGGYGRILKAVQLRLDREVALKVLPPERAEDPMRRERFVEEAHKASRLSHPNVLPVFDAGEDDGLLYIAMPLVPAPSEETPPNLNAILERSPGGRLDDETTIVLTGQVAAAIDAAHVTGLVHGDIKPDNVLISAQAPGHAFLADFGVAEVLHDEPRGPRGRSRNYRLAEDNGPAGDIYSLTTVLFECLTGHRAFAGTDALATDAKHRDPKRPSVTNHRPDLHPSIDAVIAQGVSVDAAARPKSAAALIAAAAKALRLPRPEPDSDRVGPPDDPRANDPTDTD